MKSKTEIIQCGLLSFQLTDVVFWFQFTTLHMVEGVKACKSAMKHDEVDAESFFVV